MIRRKSSFDFWYCIVSMFLPIPIINDLLPIEYNMIRVSTANIRLISMDICNPGNFLNTFGGACWIDNYMGIDDNNCILCFLKPVIMIRYSCYEFICIEPVCDWHFVWLFVCNNWEQISEDMKPVLMIYCRCRVEYNFYIDFVNLNISVQLRYTNDII